MDILTIALVAVTLAAIWLLVELALTVRRARSSVGTLDEAAAQVKTDVARLAEEAGPVLAHLDEAAVQAKPVLERAGEVLGDARPAAGQLEPLLSRGTEAVEALSASLERVDAILGDVSRISGAAGNATVAVNDAATSIAGKARALFSRGKAQGGARAAVPASIPAEEPTFRDVCDPVEEEGVEGHVVSEVVNRDEGYFTYPAEPADGRA